MTFEPEQNGRAWPRIVLFIIMILAVTFFAYYPCLNNGFTHWDDDRYVVTNKAIRSLSWENIRQMLTSGYDFRDERLGTDPQAVPEALRLKEYLPLTVLSYALEYRYFQLDPFAYHATNLILHLANSLLVFWFFFLFSGSGLTAFLVGLLFGVHPLHVESVAWVAERKDVLYSFFFLGSLVNYLYYTRDGSWKNYYAAIFLFVCAMLSKSMAITLPFLLLLIDYGLERRVVLWGKIKEKIPFFIVMLAFGAGKIWLIQQVPAFVQSYSGQVLANIPKVCFVVLFYLKMAVWPAKMSCIYPYYYNGEGLSPFALWGASIVMAGISLGIILSRKYTRKVIFGALFFLIVLFPVSQLIRTPGPAIVADRYFYISSLGLFYLFVQFLQWLCRRTSRWPLIKFTLAVVMVLAVAAFALLSRQRCGVWKDDLALWNDVISKYGGISLAYNARGMVFLHRADHEQAIRDFSLAVELAPGDAKAWNNRGIAYGLRYEYPKAVEDFTRAIGIDPNYANAFHNRAMTYQSMGDHRRALVDFQTALRLNPHYAVLYQQSKAGGLRQEFSGQEPVFFPK